MHYCTNCGKKIQNGIQFCPYCGHKQHYATGNTNVSSKTYNTPQFQSNNHHVRHLWRWIIAVIVIVACIFGFAQYKKRTSLSYILSSHPWTIKVTNTSNPNGKLHTAQRKLSFKNNKILKDGHVFGYYSLPSQNSIEIRFKYEYHIINHARVSKKSSKELELTDERSRMPKSYANKMISKHNIDKSALPQEEQNIFNGKSIKADETTRLVAD